MPAVLFGEPLGLARQVFLDGNGVPLAKGSVGTFEPGTSTPKATWQDNEMTIVNANPVPLDPNGSAVIYGSGDYRIVVEDSFHNLVSDSTGYALEISQFMQGLLLEPDEASLLAAIGTIPVIDTVANLRLETWAGGTVPEVLVVEGFASLADGGGGLFVNKIGDTSLDNGGTIFVDAGGNRWWRQFSGGLSPYWWGGQPNGSDTSSILTSMLAALGLRGGEIDFDAGVWTYQSAVGYAYPATAGYKVTLKGAGAKFVWTSGGNGLTLTANLASQGVSVEGIEFTTTSVGVGIGLSLVQTTLGGATPASEVKSCTFCGSDGGLSVQSWAKGVSNTGWSGMNFDSNTFMGPSGGTGTGIAFGTGASRCNVGENHFSNLSFGLDLTGADHARVGVQDWTTSVATKAINAGGSAATNYIAPLVQMGSAAVVTTGTAITFPIAYGSTPRITLSVDGNTPSIGASKDTISSSGFTAYVTANATVEWIASGIG